MASKKQVQQRKSKKDSGKKKESQNAQRRPKR
jgi:hypothetical protein